MTKLQEALNLLENNDVVAMPTETVYGLAASINSEAGINKIFKTKDRPFFDPLIVHVASIKQAKGYTNEWSDVCELLVSTFWPGPLTIIVPKNEKVSDLITSGHNTVGLRMPNHPIALELIRKHGFPLAAPSANKFKQTSPTSAKHVQDEFPGLLVLDGGECDIGIESTIVAVNDNGVEILRPGMISLDEISKLLKDKNINVNYASSPVAPGQLVHHYMPKLPIIVSSNFTLDKELQLAPKELTHKAVRIEFHSDPHIVARTLYSELRKVDFEKYSAILIELPSYCENESKWKGIINRVTKAATYRMPC